jgi:hypothetical protein
MNLYTQPEVDIATSIVTATCFNDMWGNCDGALEYCKTFAAHFCKKHHTRAHAGAAMNTDGQ